jgi:hypothetical protein
MARFLIIVGIVILAVGPLWPVIERLGFGRLAGDILIQSGNFTFYPIMSCILLSIELSGVLWLINR